MMKISINNYQEYAMEFIEGTLSAELNGAFEAFMAEEKQVAEEIASLCHSLPVLGATHQKYPDKRDLYRGLKSANSLRRLTYVASLAAAAVICVLMVRSDILLNNSHNQTNIVAHTDNTQQTLATNQAAEQSNHPADEVVSNTATPIIEQTKPLERHKTTSGIKVDLNKSEGDSSLPKNAPTSFEGADISAMELKSVDYYAELKDSPVDQTGKFNQVIIASRVQVKRETFTLSGDLGSEVLASLRESVSGGTSLRQVLARVIAPIDRLNPITFFKTDSSSGVRLASLTVYQTERVNRSKN